MAWTSLADRLHSLPLIICGPILRRVESNNVSVWIALRNDSDVMLTIHDQYDFELVSTGWIKPIQLGVNLFIVTITAEVIDNSFILEPDKIYTYNLLFESISSFSINNLVYSSGELRDDWISGGIDKIAYVSKNFDLPSFCLPTSDINNLRILHGSCRKPHGQGFDARYCRCVNFKRPENPIKRPQQLFLTGDQIYADDVADLLMYFIMDANKVLIGNFENIMMDGNQITDYFKPGVGERGKVAENANLTAGTDVMKNHLMRFGEYSCMYLFIWSNILWQIPDEINFPEIDSILNDEELNSENWYLINFESTLPEVRRSLANISCYMIFDDHDVTDDWNLNKIWCKNVYGNEQGKRIITNALLAYSLYQDWGNRPKTYSIEGQALAEVFKEIKLNGINNFDNIDNYDIFYALLNIRIISEDDVEMGNSGTLCSIWYYYINWENHQLLVLDTRTTRAWPNDEFDGCSELISENNLIKQVESWAINWASQNVKLTFVISPSPVFGVPFIENILDVVHIYSNIFDYSPNNEYLDKESWSAQNKAVLSLLAKLQRSNRNVNNIGIGRFVLLSGDVHYGFSNRSEIWSNKFFGQVTNEKLQTVLIQLNSSSFKNQEIKTKILHNIGYGPNFIFNPPQIIIRGYSSDEFTSLVIGKIIGIKENMMVEIPWNFIGDHIEVIENLYRKLILIPDWAMLMNYFIEDNSQFSKNREKDITNTNYENFKKEISTGILDIESFNNLEHDIYSHWSGGKEIVGKNNLGEVFIEWGVNENEKFINHWLWWEKNSLKVKNSFQRDPYSEFNKYHRVKSGIFTTIVFPYTKYRIPVGLSDADSSTSPRYEIPEPKPIGF
ncbi:MAG: hypothetical protein IPH93_00030 [Saprospiraceae bacterium]|nr:hypothetical protein [Saprospiraceae bacterium]